MTIEGWVAVSKFGLMPGTFREDPDEADEAARQILRLLGGPPLLAGFRLRTATLIVDDVDDKAGERECIPISEGRRPDGVAIVPA
jgi:hypothetical protein